MIIKHNVQASRNSGFNFLTPLQTVTHSSNNSKGDAIFGAGYGTVGALSPARSEREPSSNKKID